MVVVSSLYRLVLALSSGVRFLGRNNTFDDHVTPCILTVVWADKNRAYVRGKGWPSRLQVLEGKLVHLLLLFFFFNVILLLEERDFPSSSMLYTPSKTMEKWGSPGYQLRVPRGGHSETLTCSLATAMRHPILLPGLLRAGLRCIHHGHRQSLTCEMIVILVVASPCASSITVSALK